MFFFLSFLFSDGLDTVEAVSGEQDHEQNYNGNSSRRNEFCEGRGLWDQSKLEMGI
ncbi:hypothetical protein HanRHA438_Chr00c06g0845781 [Helianthus annuus]|nr:hypothetical protein HanRHA438_Chr00c06g0845781 [Helianthus annuus]